MLKYKHFATYQLFGSGKRIDESKFTNGAFIVFEPEAFKLDKERHKSSIYFNQN